MSFKHSPKTPKTPTAVKIQSEDFLYGNQNNFGYYRNVNATFENQENYPFQYVHPNYAAYNFPSAYHNNYEGGNQSSQFNIKHEGYKYANETSQNHYSQFNSRTNSRNGFNTSNYGKFNSDSRKRKRENQHGYDEDRPPKRRTYDDTAPHQLKKYVRSQPEFHLEQMLLPRYTVSVKINGQKYFGIGCSRRAAECRASANALRIMRSKGFRRRL